MSYTKGPWKVNETCDQPLRVIADTPDGAGPSICTLSPEKPAGDQTPEVLANARLLSAAPTMLRALEELLGIGSAGVIERRCGPGFSWYALDEVKRIAGDALRKAKES